MSAPGDASRPRPEIGPRPSEPHTTPDVRPGPYSAVGDRIATVRRGLGLTQAAFAAQLGLGLSTVLRAEGGRAVPCFAVLRRIAAAGSVTVDWLWARPRRRPWSSGAATGRRSPPSSRCCRSPRGPRARVRWPPRSSRSWAGRVSI